MPYNRYYVTPEIDIQGTQRVNGYNAAMGYPVAPLASVALWDPTNNRIYIKSGSQTGLPEIRVFEEAQQVQNAPQQSYNQSYTQPNMDMPVTKQDIDSLQTQIYQIQNELRRITNAATIANEPVQQQYPVTTAQ